MKNAILSVVVLSVLGGLACAEFLNPPGWEQDDYYTYQGWSFEGGLGVTLPDDGGAGNPYGDAQLLPGTAAWEQDLGLIFDPYTFETTPVVGGLVITGPQEDTAWFTVTIPNMADPTMKKEIWFELIARVPDEATAAAITGMVSFDAYAGDRIDDAVKFDYSDEYGEPVGIDPVTGAVWLRFEGKFSYDPQPDLETLVFSGSLDPGIVVALDRIDIATHCIPEPATLLLLGAGFLAIRRRS